MDNSMESLRIYIRDIKSHETAEYNEREDLIKAKAGDRDALDRIVSNNLRLVISIARKHLSSQSSLDLNDLIQEGNIGLITAIDRFSLDKNVKFCTYATYWINQKISRAMQNNGRAVRIPVYIIEKIGKYNKVVAGMRKQLDREPTDAEVAAEMELSESDIKKIKDSIIDTISIDMPIGSEDDKTTIGDFIEDSYGDPSNIVSNSKEVILSVLDTLTPQEKIVLTEYYGLVDGRQKSLEQVGEMINRSKETARQIKNKALQKLRQPLRANILKEEI